MKKLRTLMLMHQSLVPPESLEGRTPPRSRSGAPSTT